MSLTPINPDDWDAPVGYSNAMLGEGQRILFIAGQVAFDAEQNVLGVGDLVVQFEQAVKNLLHVLQTAGGQPSDVARLTIYVQDRDDYRDRLKEIGTLYRAHLGDHYPAMTLVEVARFFEPDVLIEIEATAVLEK